MGPNEGPDVLVTKWQILINDGKRNKCLFSNQSPHRQTRVAAI